MRHRLLILFFLLSISFWAQDNINVWGLEYGLMQAQLKERIRREKGYDTPYWEHDKSICYENCIFEGEQATGIVFHFLDGKFYYASVFIEPSEEEGIFALFDKFKELLTLEYKKPPLFQ